MNFSQFAHYKKLFCNYDDVVDLSAFCIMLGGVSEKAALRLMHENRVKHFYIGQQYQIPKLYVIEYVLSQDYAEYRTHLKVRI